MKNNILKFGLVLLATSIVIVSCKKARETIDEVQTTIEISGNQAITENLTADTYDMLQEAAVDKNLMGGRVDEVQQTTQTLSCATVTATGNFPNKLIVIDFGTAGCTSNNGIFRKGKINVTLTDSLRKTGSIATITFDNYFVNTFKKEGTITWTNTSVANSATRSWNRKVANGKITNTVNNNYWTFTSDINLTQTAGVNTPNILTDDVHTLSGTQTTTNSAGSSRTLTTQTALQKKASCANVDQGILKVQGPNHFALIDFGNGTCDNQATVSVDGRPSTTITLR
jgi:hypothetical protein